MPTLKRARRNIRRSLRRQKGGQQWKTTMLTYAQVEKMNRWPDKTMRSLLDHLHRYYTTDRQDEYDGALLGQLSRMTHGLHYEAQYQVVEYVDKAGKTLKAFVVTAEIDRKISVTAIPISDPPVLTRETIEVARIARAYSPRWMVGCTFVPRMPPRRKTYRVEGDGFVKQSSTFMPRRTTFSEIQEFPADDASYRWKARIRPDADGWVSIRLNDRRPESLYSDTFVLKFMWCASATERNNHLSRGRSRGRNSLPDGR